MTREQRAASRDKDLLEKSRLQARNRPGQPPHTQPGNPVVPVRNSPMYCDEYDRFNRDVAGELHAKKQQELQKKEVGSTVLVGWGRGAGDRGKGKGKATDGRGRAGNSSSGPRKSVHALPGVAARGRMGPCALHSPLHDKIGRGIQ